MTRNPDLTARNPNDTFVRTSLTRKTMKVDVLGYGNQETRNNRTVYF